MLIEEYAEFETEPISAAGLTSNPPAPAARLVFSTFTVLNDKAAGTADDIEWPAHNPR